MERSVEYHQELVRSLAALPTEVEWTEFKVNDQDPERIAKYISAMSNEASLCDRVYGYVVSGSNKTQWGKAGKHFPGLLAIGGEYIMAGTIISGVIYGLAALIVPGIGISQRLLIR